MPDIRQKVAEDRNRSDKNDNYINNNCDNKFPDASQLRGQLFNGSRPSNNANTGVSHQSQNSSQSSFNHNTAVTNMKQVGGDLYPSTAGNDNRRFSLEQDVLPRLRRPRRSSQEFDDLVKRKGEISKRLTNKICVMKEEKSALQEEIKQNELVGQKLVQLVSGVAQLAEIDKMKLHIAEMDKMTALLVSLSGRLARVETEMEAMAAVADTDEKKSLQRKRERLAEKLVEAKSLKDLKDKMGEKIVGMMSKYLGQAELAEYDKFVSNKVRLVMEMKEVVDKIRLGEEQLTALDCCSDQLIVPIVPVTSL